MDPAYSRVESGHFGAEKNDCLVGSHFFQHQRESATGRTSGSFEKVVDP